MIEEHTKIQTEEGHMETFITFPEEGYSGRFIDDYVYNQNSPTGTLDQCNGMTVNGQYGYYVTEAYPWVLKCFKGTPDSSFQK